jgi:hypothetical protein
MMSRRSELAGVAALGCGYAAVQVLGRRAGSSAQERAALLPGDELVTRPQMVMDHAVTVRARPDRVWPWLSQMGWHLGGYYTPGWVDRLFFPQNWRSLDRLDPALVRELQVGDVIPDGKPGTAYFRVARVDPGRLLVLRSTTHVPPGWGDTHRARITWTWTFHLTEREEGSTRVHLRVRGRMSPWWFTALYVATIVPADLVMSTGMLRGLAHRVERSAPPESSGREPMRPGRYVSDAEPQQDAVLAVYGSHRSTSAAPEEVAP